MRGPPGTFPAVPAMYWSKRRSCCGDALRTTHPQHPPSLSCARYGHEDRTTGSATNVNRARARRRIFAGLLGPRRRGDRTGGAATPAAAAVSSRAGWASRSPAAKAGDPQRHHPHAERGTCRRLQHRVPRLPAAGTVHHRQAGRTLRLREHGALLRQVRRDWAGHADLQAIDRQHRTVVQRSIAWLTGPKGRYRKPALPRRGRQRLSAAHPHRRAQPPSTAQPRPTSRARHLGPGLTHPAPGPRRDRQTRGQTSRRDIPSHDALVDTRSPTPTPRTGLFRPLLDLIQ
jgi:hypothetical protein